LLSLLIEDRRSFVFSWEPFSSPEVTLPNLVLKLLNAGTES